MIVPEILFISVNTCNITALTLIYYLFNRMYSTKSYMSNLLYLYLLFLLVSCVLIWYNLDLFGLIILLSETLVFFYFFLLFLSTTLSYLRHINRFNLFKLLLFIILCYPCYYSFYNYVITNWFSVFRYNYSDVFGLFLVLYYFESMSLLSIGLLLTVCTYVLCFLTLLLSISQDSVTNKPTKISKFFTKTQNKSTQVNRKPYIFTYSWYYDN